MGLFLLLIYLGIYFVTSTAYGITDQAVIEDMDRPEESNVIDVTQTSTPSPTYVPTATSSSTPSISDTTNVTPTITYTPTLTNTPTRTHTPTATQTPTRTPIPSIDIYDVYDNLQDMTPFQYMHSIVGQPVRQTVEISNVDERGRASIYGPWSPWLFNVSEFCVIVTGVPANIALQLDGGDVVYLEARIDRIVDDYGYFFNCEYTFILVYELIE